MTSDTETLTSMGLAVTETRPNNIAISTLIKMIVSELFRVAEMIDEFIALAIEFVIRFLLDGMSVNQASLYIPNFE
jgi:hypothetical protein